MAPAPNTICVACLYYPSYRDRCIAELKNLMLHMPGKGSLVTIVNNKELGMGGFDDDISRIQGSNSNGEFSAWDEGISHILLTYGRSNLSGTLFVFANDTFCHHHAWDDSIAKSTASTFLRCSGNNAAISGEMNHLPWPSLLSRTQFSTWISSYLFCMNYTMLSELDFKLSPLTECLSKYIVGGTSSANFFSSELDACLAKHASNWLFGGGWYKSKSLSLENMELMRIKARAVLSEKFMWMRISERNPRIYLFNNIYSIIANRIYFLVGNLVKHGNTSQYKS